MNNFHYNVKQQKEGIIMSVENVRAYLKKLGLEVVDTIQFLR